MKVTRAWQDSLRIFLPKNFRLFVLATANALQHVYLRMLQFWWVVAGFFIIYIGMGYLSNFVEPISEDNALAKWLFASGLLVAYTLIFSLYVAFICLLARPSVLQKNFRYLQHYLKRLFIGAMGIFLLAGIIFLFLSAITVGIFSVHWLIVQAAWSESYPVVTTIVTYILFGFVVTIALFLYYPVYLLIPLLFGFFYIDTDGKTRYFVPSMVRAIKMFFYNLPFWVLSFLVIWVLYRYLIYFLALALSAFPLLFELLSSALLFLLIPIPITIFVNYYIKKVHDQFDIYFTQPE